jgi:hypothetical protein
MKIAIIGSGNVGLALGKGWAAKGHLVTFGVRDTAKKIAGGLKTAKIAEAVAGADCVVLAVPWPAAQSTIAGAGTLAGKILIDCTNPVKADLSGLEIGLTTSAGEQVAAWAKGAKVYKAFNTTGAGNMASSAGYLTKPAMFVCGDDSSKKPAVMGLVKDLGFEAIDVGNITQSRLLEPLAMLWMQMGVKMGMGMDIAFGVLRR